MLKHHPILSSGGGGHLEYHLLAEASLYQLNAKCERIDLQCVRGGAAGTRAVAAFEPVRRGPLSRTGRIPKARSCIADFRSEHPGNGIWGACAAWYGDPGDRPVLVGAYRGRTGVAIWARGAARARRCERPRWYKAIGA